MTTNGFKSMTCPFSTLQDPKVGAQIFAIFFLLKFAFNLKALTHTTFHAILGLSIMSSQ